VVEDQGLIRMKTVLAVIGTRSEAIKMAPVIQQLLLRSDRVRSLVCSTGQHREMLQQVLDLFQITPDIDLALMRPRQSLADLTAGLITGLDRVLRDVEPDWTLALGDTTTVFAAALASCYRGVPFGHVEAGLRSGDKRQPFPEEINRRMTDVVADMFFAPSERARRRLIAEGVDRRAVRLVGNTVIDALRAVAAKPYDWSAGPLAAVPRDARLVLVTAHRRESFGEPLREILRAVAELEETFRAEGVCFVFPVHLNPEVRTPANEILAGRPGVRLMEPLDYCSMVHLIERCELVLTDSGGIQEEAPSLGAPVLLLRQTCEQPEDVDSGAVRLVGHDRRRIVREAERLLRDPAARAAMAASANPAGDGHAAERIVSFLLNEPVQAEWTEPAACESLAGG
jgi:UDP-N-acetylglucosamine 2-epimerase (non-hydrolysing)